MTEPTTGTPAEGGTAAPAGQPAPTSFLEQLPEEYRADPAFASFKESGLPGLAKSYAHASRMVGADKIALPGKDAAPDAWGDVWNRLGRPATAADYEYPIPAEDSPFQHDAKMMEGFRSVAHEAGLTNKQVASLIGWYNEYGQGLMEGVGNDAAAFEQGSVDALRKEWGNAFDSRLTLARRAVADFGGEDVQKVLEETGLGNHPAIVKMFADLGEAMVEDTLPGTTSGNFGHTPESAQEEINRLQLDPNFIKAYTDGDHPGHAEAVAKMRKLFADAHPEPRTTSAGVI